MRTLNAYSLTVVVILAATLLAASTDDDVEKTYDFDVSPGETVEFDLKSGGKISILGWDKPRAKVSYIQRGKGRLHDIEILQQRGGLRIASNMEPIEGKARELAFEIRLPHKYNVRFESMGGSLKIMDLEGKFTGSTMGGGLTLKEVKGRVTLKTMGGPIEVTSSDLDGTMSTMGGTVYLKDVIGSLDATSMGGNVRYENVRDRDGELRGPEGSPSSGMDVETVTISTMGGSIEVDDAPAGAIVSTMGGDVDVDGASGFVKANTMGGSIDIEMADGWVHAHTMAGNIDVEIEGGLGEGEKGVKLTSYSGDITLEIPPDLSMEFDLTIAYTKNSSQDYKIISDFDLEIERTKEWDYSNGTPRKRITGTGKVGGGRHPIEIDTINGNIRIEKAD